MVVPWPSTPENNKRTSAEMASPGETEDPKSDADDMRAKRGDRAALLDRLSTRYISLLVGLGLLLTRFPRAGLCLSYREDDVHACYVVGRGDEVIYPLANALCEMRRKEEQAIRIAIRPVLKDKPLVACDHCETYLKFSSIGWLEEGIHPIPLNGV